MEKRPEIRQKDSIATAYEPSNWNELQYQNQNRLKSRRFHPKKKSNYRLPPFAPRNTTSFLIRAKRSDGIASLVSPYLVTPDVLSTPIFSPLRVILVDMAKEEWGLDGYGSMKGLIRLRSLKDEDDEEDEGGDHDLSRFEMICPISGGEEQSSTLLESRMDDQDFHIAQLEEENLALKERVFFMERELEDLRRSVQFLRTPLIMVALAILARKRALMTLGMNEMSSLSHLPRSNEVKLWNIFSPLVLLSF